MATAQPVPAGKGPPTPQVDGQPPEEILEEGAHSGMPPWLEAAFPWMVSITFHMGLGLVFAFAIWINNAKSADDTEKIIVPLAFADESVQQVEHPGVDGDPNRDARQNLIEDVKTQGWASEQSDEKVASLLAGDQGENVVDMIANGTGGSTGAGKNGAGQGRGGVLAPYGTPGGGRGIGVKFYNQSVTAKKIVYILDHSGSMLDTFDFLRQEAIQSVNKMLPVMAFSVVMVSEHESVIFPTLQRATPDVKKDFAAKLQNYRAQGMNDDLLEPFQKAFEAAFAMQPEVIYFLTDGHFDPKLTQVVDNLNKGKKVRVNTLAFVNHDPSYEEQLQEMAKKNNGLYKFVAEKDLGK